MAFIIVLAMSLLDLFGITVIEEFEFKESFILSFFFTHDHDSDKKS